MIAANPLLTDGFAALRPALQTSTLELEAARLVVGTMISTGTITPGDLDASAAVYGEHQHLLEADSSQFVSAANAERLQALGTELLSISDEICETVTTLSDMGSTAGFTYDDLYGAIMWQVSLVLEQLHGLHLGKTPAA